MSHTICSKTPCPELAAYIIFLAQNARIQLTVTHTAADPISTSQTHQTPTTLRHQGTHSLVPQPSLAIPHHRLSRRSQTHPPTKKWPVGTSATKRERRPSKSKLARYSSDLILSPPPLLSIHLNTTKLIPDPLCRRRKIPSAAPNSSGSGTRRRRS
jgi:hypothetical protein